MLIHIQEWILDVDIDATMKYSSELFAEHCECGYCRNYYSTVCDIYPELNTLLTKLGINHESPVDFLPIEPTLCIISYALCGSIVKHGSQWIAIGEAMVSFQESNLLDYELSCGEPYFVLTTSALRLPWVLEEDMDEVISPANEPECLERMWKKLLDNAVFNDYQS